jgi:hypothetical protein
MAQQGFFELVSYFKEASKNFIYTLLPKKQPTKLETISNLLENTNKNFKTFQRYSSRDTIPLSLAIQYTVYKSV